jgi:hypothetical protein
VSFTAINLCIASQRVFDVISLPAQCGNVWIHPRILMSCNQIAGKFHSVKVATKFLKMWSVFNCLELKTD